MAAVDQAQHRQQNLYWNQLIELKVACGYIRRYRDRQSVWVRRFAVLKAVASSGSIAGWAVWKDYAFIWGMIIALAQLADALSGALPFTKIHKAASEHTVALDGMFIDAQLEWEAIFAGRVADEEIANRLHRLRKAQHAAESKHFPDGLAVNQAMFDLAQREAQAYIEANYDV